MQGIYLYIFPHIIHSSQLFKVQFPIRPPLLHLGTNLPLCNFACIFLALCFTAASILPHFSPCQLNLPAPPFPLFLETGMGSFSPPDVTELQLLPPWLVMAMLARAGASCSPTASAGPQIPHPHFGRICFLALVTAVARTQSVRWRGEGLGVP